MLLHTDTLHTNTFTHRDRTAEIAILPQFFAIKLHFLRKGCAGHLQIAILPQFLNSFRAKGLCRTPTNRNFISVFGDQTSFCTKGLRWTPEIAILLRFLAIELRFVPKGCAGHANRNFTSVFGYRTSFRVRPETRNRNFTSVFGDRTSFRAKGLHFVPSCWHGPVPSREK